MRLFHVSPQPLPRGFVLTAGHFGQMIESFTTQNASVDNLAPWRMASEMIVELVRATEFSHRPSRLSCCYAWVEERAARQYLSDAPPGYCLTEVEMMSPDAKCFVADFALMSATTRYREDKPFLPWNVGVARQYWSGEDIQLPELLVESHLRVVQVLESSIAA